MYILNDDIALHSYANLLFCYTRLGNERPVRLTTDEFITLKKCDGQTDIEYDEVLKKLIDDKVIRPVKDSDDRLKKWQEHRISDNPFTPCMTLAITEKCNFNCMHCFNAVDSGIPSNHLSYDQITYIIDEAYNAGILQFKITGGEPLVHPEFTKIVNYIYDNGMWIYMLNTNGYLLDADMLDMLRRLPVIPQINISYDGIGFHDKMRGVTGAQSRTLAAIKSCVDADVPLQVTLNINKLNEDVILPSLIMLDEMGVSSARVIRTTEAPRWKEKSGAALMSWRDYYEKSLAITEGYMAEDHFIFSFFEYRGRVRSEVPPIPGMFLR